MIVGGSLENLQSSLDFYLSITSKSVITSPKDMRDRFFSIFGEEDSSREDNFLLYHSEDDEYDIVENANPVLVGDEVEFVGGMYSFSCVEESCPFEEEVFVDDTYKLENEKSKFSSFSHSLEEEENEIEDEFIVSEIEFADLEIEEAYSDIEEYVVDTEKSDLENENIELDDDEFIDYSSSETEKNDLENEIIEEEIMEDNSWSDLDEEEPFGSWGDSDDEFVEYEEEENVEIVNEVEEDKENIWGNSDLDTETSIWGDFEEELPKFDDTIIVKEEVEVTKKVVNVSREVVEEVIDVPKDLREFVKKYHNCEMSFALKYFTKKEIDKQLSLGRIFKRKNRLLI